MTQYSVRYDIQLATAELCLSPSYTTLVTTLALALHWDCLLVCTILYWQGSYPSYTLHPII